MEWSIDFQIVSFAEVCLRVALACVFGFILGMERTIHQKPLGYRVYIIVSVITCLIAIMGLELNETLQTISDNITLDLGKIISGILMGIGFIGAGAFMQQREDHLVGSTTGACIWAAGGLGLLLGFGFYFMALIGMAVIVFVLVGLNKILEPFMKDKRMDND